MVAIKRWVGEPFDLDMTIPAALVESRRRWWFVEALAAEIDSAIEIELIVQDDNA